MCMGLMHDNIPHSDPSKSEATISLIVTLTFLILRTTSAITHSGHVYSLMETLIEFCMLPFPGLYYPLPSLYIVNNTEQKQRETADPLE